ncbi:hypothetical protein IU501_14390 [Nocardia otitidiscaviarum]|uniref:Uncharacterized protein n=1 Tax=Nocardia otitidiscaviarum TaxID=1823 RepID=A0A378YEY3_9NOCA|nr:hypothetical protein [Nocardia otitidiscaviarum]MBF6134181.1 hypothetical protein [Nocardia otitidiscaviarum]MBF6236158.1 hypothetical protein [Nocardia otitidiscaviarum]MBF6484157.1 hypothetical protein [Nocardia otitidiscaviarum]SUA75795.1 Uncharacterised protein [Nocardia otitidiscaviarum]
MDDGAWVVLIMAVVVAIAPIWLLWLRRRRIKRYGVGGGEFNHPFATMGYGGVPPGTSIQAEFGGPGTSEPMGRGSDDPDDEPGERRRD